MWNPAGYVWVLRDTGDPPVLGVPGVYGLQDVYRMLANLGPRPTEVPGVARQSRHTNYTVEGPGGSMAHSSRMSVNFCHSDFPPVWPHSSGISGINWLTNLTYLHPVNC